MGSNISRSAVTLLGLWYCQSLSIGSNNRMVDLRSDTVTRPSPAMRTAMFEAEVGDDVFGDDPTVHLLENKVSGMFGKESALFFPSGTMSNLAATMSWCGKRGSEIILGDSSHMFLYEQGGVAQLAGVLPRAIMNQRDGTLSLDSVEKAVRQNNIHFPVTELIALEDTHNFCGGRVLPKGYLDDVSKIARSRNVAVHLDGARIWNAAAVSKSSLADITRGADSVSVCLSKGLGAPSGSLLLGPREFIERARRCRKALGGGMRQVGILAAAGLQAVTDYEVGILLPDHYKARALATAINRIAGFSVNLDAVETNIVLVNVDREGLEPSTVAAMLRDRGVLALPFGVRSVRLVTHRDILDGDVEITVLAFQDVSNTLYPPPVTAAKAEVSSSSSLTPADELQGMVHGEIDTDSSSPSETEVETAVDPVSKNVNTRRLITKVLQNREIFRPDLTMSEFKFIVDAAQGIRVMPGDVVIRMGDSAEFFYVIESGRVDFYLEPTGEYLNCVKSLTTGGFFGEIALMYDAPRAATVIAATETTLWRIHKNDFFSIQKAPDNALGFFKAKTQEEDTDELGKEMEEEVVGTDLGESGRLSVAEAQAEASRTAGFEEDSLEKQSDETNKEEDDELFAVNEVESFETWEEEELQGLESGGQAVSLTEDEEEELVASEAIIMDDDVVDEAVEHSSEYYEEAVIHGMSLSDDGFCVLLKGVVCDRVLRVLVTPSDPMSDGLDIDQVETSEAVTLLQLLQGIDVESVLARDALAVKFAESGPGKQQYVLQRVMVDGVSTSKTFHARLLGTALSSSNTQAPPQASNPLTVAVVPQHNFDHPVFETLPHSLHLPDPSHSPIYEVDTYPPEAPPSVPLSSLLPGVIGASVDSPQERNLLSDGRSAERQVELNCAFEAIALALRHSAVVEVLSSLLQDEHFSYSLEELPSFFPKLVESGISADEHGRFGADYDSKSEMERLQRRLFEAIRQGNSVKIDTIKRQLEFYSHIEGRSVLILPPPPLFLAPDIIPVEDVQMMDMTSNVDPLPQPPVGTMIDTFEITESIDSTMVGETSPDSIGTSFQFDSQIREQAELEEEQMDQLDLLQMSLEGEEGEEGAEKGAQEDNEDGLGRQLTSIYNEDEILNKKSEEDKKNRWKW